MATNIANVNTVAGDISNVNTVAGNNTNINTVANNNSNINTVANNNSAISAVAGFVTEETPADDEHVVRLTELQDERARTVEQLQNADTQRRNIFNSITMAEGALQILAQVLTSAGLGEETAESATTEGAGTEAE